MKLIQSLSIIALITFSFSFGMKPLTYGLEPVAKKAKEEVDACTQFMDAAIHGKKSRFYNAKYKPKYYHNGDNDGVTPLHRAILAGDVQDCINLLAAGNDWRKPLFNGQTYLHIAAQQGFDSFSDFMLLSGFDVNTPLGITSHTALLVAAEAKKPTTCKLLLEHGAHPISKNLDYTWNIFDCLAFKPEVDVDLFNQICKLLAEKQKDRTPKDIVEKPGNVTFDLALQKFKPEDIKRLCKIMPSFILLGEGSEVRDHHGKTPLDRLLFQYSDTPTNLRCGLLNYVAIYHAALEAQELPAAKTALLINKYEKSSLLWCLPRDVLIKCVLKFVVPFRVKAVDECVKHQLLLFNRLLTSSYTQEVVESIRSQLPDQRDADEILDLINTDKLDQYSPQLTQLTRLLMDLPAQES